jgi:DNA-directed RNA polymerase subunit RPC12/RpoP
VAPRDPSCPICGADLPLSGDEQIGDEVFCTYCGAPCILQKDAEDPDEFELEEDF